jgi:hypothetical protein
VTSSGTLQLLPAHPASHWQRTCPLIVPSAHCPCPEQFGLVTHADLHEFCLITTCSKPLAVTPRERSCDSETGITRVSLAPPPLRFSPEGASHRSKM